MFRQSVAADLTTLPPPFQFEPSARHDGHLQRDIEGAIAAGAQVGEARLHFDLRCNPQPMVVRPASLPENVRSPTNTGSRKRSRYEVAFIAAEKVRRPISTTKRLRSASGS